MIFKSNLVIASKLHYYSQVSPLVTIILMLLQNLKKLLLKLLMLLFIIYFGFFLLCLLFQLLIFLFFMFFVNFRLRLLTDWRRRGDQLILGLSQLSFGDLFFFKYFEFVLELSLLSIECEQTLLLFFCFISLHLLIIFYLNKTINGLLILAL